MKRYKKIIVVVAGEWKKGRGRHLPAGETYTGNGTEFCISAHTVTTIQ